MKLLLSCFGFGDSSQAPSLPPHSTKDKPTHLSSLKRALSGAASLPPLQHTCLPGFDPVLETVSESLTDQRPLAALKEEGYSWRAAAAQDRSQLENLDDDCLTPLACLGEGAHGTVDLCVARSMQASEQHSKASSSSQAPQVLVDACDEPSLVVAVKTVPVGRQQERELLMLHRTQGLPFVPQFFGFIDDGRECRYVMEWAEGGDMADFLEALKKHRGSDVSRPLMSECSAAFYAACMLLALEGLHCRRLLHRDVKPGNLLMCSNGVAKLSDLGFTVALDSRGQAVGCCGTQGYMAPEVWLYGLENNYQTYGAPADLWSVGATIYEMITGLAMVKEQEEVTKRWSVPLHPCFSPILRDLLSSLLNLNPKRRPQSCGDAMQHPWFAGIDWAALKKGQAEAPYVPAEHRKLPRQRPSMSAASVPVLPTQRSQPLPQRLAFSTGATAQSADLGVLLQPLPLIKSIEKVAASA